MRKSASRSRVCVTEREEGGNGEERDTAVQIFRERTIWEKRGQEEGRKNRPWHQPVYRQRKRTATPTRRVRGGWAGLHARRTCFACRVVPCPQAREMNVVSMGTTRPAVFLLVLSHLKINLRAVWTGYLPPPTDSLSKIHSQRGTIALSQTNSRKGELPLRYNGAAFLCGKAR